VGAGVKMRFGRSPLGAFIRSPLGARDAGSVSLGTLSSHGFAGVSAISLQEVIDHSISANFSCGSGRTDSPYGTQSALATDSTLISDFLGQTGNSSTAGRFRGGLTFPLASSYPAETEFYFGSVFGSFIGSPSPTLYLSGSDRQALYGNINPKTAWDWETDLSLVISFSIGVGSQRTSIPYGYLQPFFGGNCSFVFGDSDDFANNAPSGQRTYQNSGVLPVLIARY